MRALAIVTLTLVATVAAAAGKWEKPYNGKDLSGWHVESGKLDSWRANGEMISCVSPGGGYLALDKEYSDFELQLEYRLPKAGNSGVGLRFPPGGWPSTQGMEIQLLDDADPQYAKLSSVHKNASIYSFVGPKVNAAKPAGEWNKIAIRCEGPHIRIKLNGKTVQDVNIEELTKKGKGGSALTERPRSGLVGLQSHGDPVDFRNIKIREL